MNRVFARGVRLPLLKKPASKQKVTAFDTLVKVSIPVGAPDQYELTVAVGDAVSIGTVLSTAADMPLCSVTGTFEGIRTIRHPLLGETDFAVIGDITETVPPAAEMPDPATLSSAQILALIKTARVINETDGRPLIEALQAGVGCDLLVADAIEAEPYASSAGTLLRDHAPEINAAMGWLKTAIGAGEYQISTQDKPQHIRRLRELCGREHIFAARRSFPVDDFCAAPKKARVCRVGVQAVYAAYRALTAGAPHTDMIVTVAGTAVERPMNLRVPIGTPVEDLFRKTGLSAEPRRVILGDVMTGLSVESTDLPLCPNVTCVLALAEWLPDPRTCIGCGRCAGACHKGLLPYAIAAEWENMHYEQLPALRADLCDGCGACSFVCPSARDVTAKVIAAQDIGASPIFLIGGDTDE